VRTAHDPLSAGRNHRVVGVAHDVWVEHHQQRLEISGAPRGEERVDHFPPLTTVRSGIIQVNADGGISVERRLITKSGGPIELRACSPVSILPAAGVDTRVPGGGPAGDITIAGDAIDVAGKLRAPGGAIDLEYFTTAPMVSGSIDPTPTITQVAPPANCTP
jgi:hypothetical protein